MRKHWKYPACLVVVLGLLCGASPARAATSFNFLFSMDHVSNDEQYFLSLAVSNYGYSRQVLEPILPRITHIEVDLPVVLFVARESGLPPDRIVAWRSEGLSWSVIFQRAEVPVNVLFTGISQDPGPPYGKAWGHWKKNPGSVQLSDSDIAGLVHVQVGSRVAGVSQTELVKTGGNGKVAGFVAAKKGRPYQKGKSGHGGRR